MKVTDVLKGIEFWCTKDIKYTDYMCGFYKGSLNALQAVDLITDETYDKYNTMINNKFNETFKLKKRGN